jgi:spore germination cell wall hydrolase CwlJ-like protein
MIIDLFKKRGSKSACGETKEAEKAYFRSLEIDVLARTIFGEARGEPVEGQEAVASVVLNRVAIAQKRGKYWWGDTVIAVCQKPYQFSCWNRGDPSYRKLVQVDESDRHFALAKNIAAAAVEGRLKDRTKGATHYHADYVSPYWARGETPVRIIGRHLFYALVKG